jgi:N12 class adenine-specific DNA methylase
MKLSEFNDWLEQNTDQEQQKAPEPHAGRLESALVALGNGILGWGGSTLEGLGMQLKDLQRSTRENSPQGDNPALYNETLSNLGEIMRNNGQYLSNLSNAVSQSDRYRANDEKYGNMSAPEMLTSGEWWSDPAGAWTMIPSGAGSSYMPMVLSMALPTGRLAYGAQKLLNPVSGLLGNLGAKKLSSALAENVIKTAPGAFAKAPSMAAEGLGHAATFAGINAPLDALANTSEIFEPLRKKGFTDEQIAEIQRKAIMDELPMDLATEFISGGLTSGVPGKFAGRQLEKLLGKGFPSLTKRIVGAGGAALAEPLSESPQETYQTIVTNKYSGKPYGTLTNPLPDESYAGSQGAIGALPMALFEAITGFKMPKGRNLSSQNREQFFNAVREQESGNDYSLGANGDGARGAYQILNDNWAQWASDAGLSPDAPWTKENQDIVAQNKLNALIDDYGMDGALVAWYSGNQNGERWANGESTWIDSEGNEHAWNESLSNGPSVLDYVNQTMARMGEETTAAPENAEYEVGEGVSNPTLSDLTEQKLRRLDRDYYEKFGRHLYVTSMTRDGNGESWHDSGQAFDIADDFLESSDEARAFLMERAQAYGLYGLDEYTNPSEHATGGHLHFSDHGEALSEFIPRIDAYNAPEENLVEWAYRELERADDKSRQTGQPVTNERLDFLSGLVERVYENGEDVTQEDRQWLAENYPEAFSAQQETTEEAQAPVQETPRTFPTVSMLKQPIIPMRSITTPNLDAARQQEQQAALDAKILAQTPRAETAQAPQMEQPTAPTQNAPRTPGIPMTEIQRAQQQRTVNQDMTRQNVDELLNLVRQQYAEQKAAEERARQGIGSSPNLPAPLMPGLSDMNGGMNNAPNQNVQAAPARSNQAGGYTNQNAQPQEIAPAREIGQQAQALVTPGTPNPVIQNLARQVLAAQEAPQQENSTQPIQTIVQGEKAAQNGSMEATNESPLDKYNRLINEEITRIKKTFPAGEKPIKNGHRTTFKALAIENLKKNPEFAALDKEINENRRKSEESSRQEIHEKLKNLSDNAIITAKEVGSGDPLPLQYIWDENDKKILRDGGFVYKENGTEYADKEAIMIEGDFRRNTSASKATNETREKSAQLEKEIEEAVFAFARKKLPELKKGKDRRYGIVKGFLERKDAQGIVQLFANDEELVDKLEAIANKYNVDTTPEPEEKINYDEFVNRTRGQSAQTQAENKKSAPQTEATARYGRFRAKYKNGEITISLIPNKYYTDGNTDATVKLNWDKLNEILNADAYTIDELHNIVSPYIKKLGLNPDQKGYYGGYQHESDFYNVLRDLKGKVNSAVRLQENTPKIQERMKKLLEKRDIGEIIDTLRSNDNTVSIKAFSDITGVDLSPVMKTRMEQVKDYFGEEYTKWEESEKKAKAEKEREKAAREEQERKDKLEQAEKDWNDGKQISGRDFVSLCDKYEVNVPLATKGVLFNKIDGIDNEGTLHGTRGRIKKYPQGLSNVYHKLNDAMKEPVASKEEINHLFGKEEPVEASKEEIDHFFGTEQEQSAQTQEKTEQEQPESNFTTGDYVHTKTGEKIPMAKLKNRVDEATFKKMREYAKENGGYYNRYAKAFFFKDFAEGRDTFVREIDELLNGPREKSASTQSPAEIVSKMPEATEENKPRNTRFTDMFESAINQEAVAKLADEEMKKRDKNTTQKQESAPEASNTTAEESIFGSIEDADREMFEALGITPEAADNEEISFTNEFGDTTDEEIEALKKELQKELNKVSANPVFNPRIYSLGLQLGGKYIQKGYRKFKTWLDKMRSDLGEGIEPWAPAIWESLRTYPKGEKFDPKQVMAVSRAIGARYERGTTDLDAIEKDITKGLTASNKKALSPIIEASYNGIKKFFDGMGGEEGANEGRTARESGRSEGTETVSEGTGRGRKSDDERAGAGEESDRGLEGTSPENGGTAAENGNTERVRASGTRETRRQENGTDESGLGSERRERGSEPISTSVEREGRRDTGSGAGRRTNGAAGTVTGNAGVSGGKSGSAGTSQNGGNDVPVTDNYHIDDPNALFGGTPKVRFARNKRAIEVAQDLMATNRIPTPEERDAMAAFTGWGSFGQQLFQGTYNDPQPAKGWEKESEWLRDTLGKDDWESAQRSIINAHYTSPVIVQSIWDMIRRMGFKGGRVLEPSMGVGNFFGLMPKDFEQNSALFGVEMDSFTGNIAKMLYPKANIKISPYQDVHVADGTYDIIVGNVPFGDIAPADRRYDKFRANLHDYFFLKGIDELRSGGIMMAITSKGTMDKLNRGVRMELAKKAELIDAYRFPTGAFGEYAGTDVVTDVLIFKKRENPILDVSKEKWLGTTEHDSGEYDYRNGRNYTYNVNNFFENHPEKVLGTIGFGRATGKAPGLAVTMDEQNFPKQLENMVKSVPKDVYEEAHYDENLHYVSNNENDRIGTLQNKDGKLYVANGVDSAPIEAFKEWKLPASIKKEETIQARLDELKDLVKLREAYQKLEDAEKNDAKNLEEVRQELKKVYDDHIAKYVLDENGNQTYVQYTDYDENNNKVKKKRPKILEDTEGLKLFYKANEPNYFNLCALQRKDGRPARILTERVMRTGKKDLKNPTVKEALMLQRNKSMRIDVDEIAKTAHKSKKEVLEELKDYLFKTPNGDYQVADQYLAGNVRRKLREAQTAYENGDKDMKHSIDALKKVIPEDIPYYNISVGFGGTWIDIPYYQQFVGELVGTKNLDKIEITRDNKGSWRVKFNDASFNNTAGATVTYGTSRVKFDRLLTHTLNHTKPKINYKDEHGNLHPDEDAMKQANEQMDKIRETFADWVWQDERRKTELAHTYNEVMNNVATPSYDGSFLDMTGMMLTRGDKPFNLRQHQVNAIYRGLVNGSGIYAHEVGTGKTYTMGGLALESRRFGIAKKPLILAHNANSKTVAKEIQEMYPGAKILYLSGDGKNIKRDLMRVKMDDWDVVVMPHSRTNMLTLTTETLDALSADIIAQLEDDAREAAKADGINLDNYDIEDEKSIKKLRSQTAKDLVTARLKIIEQNRKYAYKASDKDAVPFEDLGIDMVIVDESHDYKKPPFSTKMNVKGLQKGLSGLSIQLNYITQYIQGMNNGKGVHLFTGTPITNTVTEMYHNMKYIMPNELKEANVYHFDDWFNTFANVTSNLEYTATGDVENIDRLNSFVNVAELRRMVGQYMDIVFADDMPEFEPRKTESGKTLADPNLTAEERDYLINGRDENAVGRPYMQTINEVIPMNDAQKGILSMFTEYAKEWAEASKMDRKKIKFEALPQDPLYTDNSMHQAAMDARLYDINANVSGMESKETRVVKNVMDIYNSDKRTTQVIMMDQGKSDSTERIPRDERGYPLGLRDEKGKLIKQDIATFNLQKSIIQKLVEAGIPEKEIAVVTGSTNPKTKAEIAEKVDHGEIRVVVGSTATLGTGVNMQSNLKAIHHIDAPWMPGDLEQRNGRILRQGNKWNTVLEYRYITEKLDGRRWQVLATKKKFIKMFMKADENLRILDGDAVDMSDEEGSGNDFEETLSKATGDPRFLRKANLEEKVKKLKKSKAAFDAGIETAKYKLQQLEESGLGQLQENVNTLQAVQDKYAQYKTNHKDSFEITLNGKKYTDKKDADQAIADIFSKSDKLNKEFKIGEFAGLDLYGYQQSGTGYNAEIRPYIRITDKGKDTVLGFDCTNSVGGITSKLANVGRAIELAQKKLDQAESDIATYRKQINGKFAREDILNARQAELEALEKDLLENPVPPPQWLVEGAPVMSDVLVDGKQGTVETYRVGQDKNSFYVGVNDGKGVKFYPWQDVKDTQGLPMITAPEGVAESGPYVEPTKESTSNPEGEGSTDVSQMSIQERVDRAVNASENNMNLATQLGGEMQDGHMVFPEYAESDMAQTFLDAVNAQEENEALKENRSAVKYSLDNSDTLTDNERRAIEKIHKNMSFGEAREQFFQEEDRHVAAALKVFERAYEATGKVTNRIKILFREAKEALEDVEEQRNQFTTEQNIADLARLLRGQGKIRKGDYLTEDVRGLLNAFRTGGNTGRLIQVPGEYARMAERIKKYAQEIKLSYQNNGKHSDNQGAFSNGKMNEAERLRREAKILPQSKLKSRQRYIQDFGKQMGVPVVFVDADPRLHGWHQGGVTYLNVKSEMPMEQVFWHESFHWMRNNNRKLYNDMVKYVSGLERFSPEQLDKYRESIGRPELTDAETIEEMMADFMINAKDRVDFMKDLAKADRSLAERFMAWLRDVMAKFQAFMNNPDAGLTNKQKAAMSRFLERHAKAMLDANNRPIFRVTPRGEILRANGTPLPAYSFAGEKSKTADTKKLYRAFAMAASGKSAQEIFKETGWLHGKDGKWRYEIPDLLSKIDFSNVIKRGVSTLERVYDNPKLYEAYPFLKKIRVEAVDMDDDTFGQALKRTIQINKNMLNDPESKKTLVHEIQHMIQAREDFGIGGDPEEVRNVLGNKAEYSSISDDDLYNRLAGEQEAREVERRAENQQTYEDAKQKLAAAEKAFADARKNGTGAEIKKAKEQLDKAKAVEGLARTQAEKTPTPHESDAIVIYDGQEIPVAAKKAAPKYSIGKKKESFAQVIRNKLAGIVGDGTMRIRKEMKDALEKAAGVSIRSGHIGDNSNVRVDNGVIRTRAAYDWETILPEAGKAIAKRLGLKPTDKMGEYVGKWILDGALNDSSQEAADFQKAMRKNPEMQDALLDARETFQKWNDMDATERLKSSIQWTKRGTLERMIMGDTTIKDELAAAEKNWYDEWIEELGSLGRLESKIEKKIGGKLKSDASALRAFRLFRGATGKAMTMVEGKDAQAVEAIKHLFPNVDFSGFKTIRMILDEAGVREDKEKFKDFMAYCVAKHSLTIHQRNEDLYLEQDHLRKKLDKAKTEDEKNELRQQIVDIGNEIMQTPQTYKECLDVIRKHEKRYGKAQKDLVRFSRITSEILLDSGLISQKRFDEMQKAWPDYVPMFRVFDENEDVQWGDSLKHVSGSKRDLVNPLESIIRNTYEFIRRAEKNKAKQKVADLAKISDVGEYIQLVDDAKPDDKTVLTYYENGQKKYIQTDPAIVSAINNMGIQSSNMFVRMLHFPAKIARAAFTLMNPAFAVRNIARDSADAYLYSKYGYNPLKDFVGGLMHAIKQDEMFWEWMSSGAAQASLISLDRDYTQSTIDRVTKSFKERLVSNPLDLLQLIGEYSEYATRIGAYERTKNAIVKRDATRAGMSAILEAAFESRDLMDFARGGKSSRAMNQLIIFSNASIQGWNKMFRTFDFRKDKKAAMAALARLAFTSILPTIFLFMLNHDKDWWKELPDWQKEKHWVMKVGDTILRIPKGMDPAIQFTSNFVEKGLSRMVDKEPIKASRLLRPLWDTMPDMLPTTFMPFIEAYANYSFFTERNIVPQYQKKLPEKMQYGPHTTSFAKWLGEKMGVSPSKIDHIIQGYTGNLGKTVADLPNLGANTLDRSLEEMPIISGLLATPFKNPKSVQEFYERFDEQEKLYNEFKITRQRPEGFDPALYGRMKKAKTQLSKLSKAERSLMNNPSIPLSDRKKRQEQIQSRRVEIIKRVMGR